jgi:hypothetical protein
MRENPGPSSSGNGQPDIHRFVEASKGSGGLRRSDGMKRHTCGGQKDHLQCCGKRGISVSLSSAMKLRIIKKEDQ